MSRFQTTRWSLVLAARDEGESAAAALGELCRCYRGAVQAFVRAIGHPTAEVEDLTQGFFLKFLEKRYDIAADPQRGRFRTYLLTALKGYLANVRDADNAAKRGGGVHIGSLDADDVAAELHDFGPTPERAFEREYALTQVALALARLRDEAEAGSRGAQFAELAAFLIEPPAAGEFRELSQRLGIAANTLSVQVRRMRLRLIELIRMELAHSVADPADVDAEMRDLQKALQAP